MKLLLVLFVGTGLAGLALASDEGRASLAVGDAAPAFSLAGSDGKTHSLADYAGKKAMVIAWFPKAFTGG